MNLIPSLDRLLRRVLVDGVSALSSSNLVSETQISFVPPDTQWRSGGTTNPGPRFSVYLVDVRENLKLRSNERIERVEREDKTGLPQRSVLRAHRMPYRMDCHYLIAAFAPLAVQTVPPAPPQHALLYEATAALIKSQPLIPAKIYPPGSTELDEWLGFADIELPMIVNPHEGFPKLAEFWGTLATDHPWQPVVYVVVTIPVEYQDGGAMEPVRRLTTVFATGVSTETFVEIGGEVRNRHEPVGRAWVIAGNSAGVELARTSSDDEGKFILKLPSAATHIWAAAFGVGVTPSLEVAMASATASTDFTLSFN